MDELDPVTGSPTREQAVAAIRAQVPAFDTLPEAHKSQLISPLRSRSSSTSEGFGSSVRCAHAPYADAPPARAVALEGCRPMEARGRFTHPQARV